ncbi:MAG: HAMP domain-containing sensor histidine kinase [Polyangiales bacterium]
MRLRTRLALTLGAATVSVLVVLGWGQSRFHTKVRLEALAEGAVHRMESGGRQECEGDPARWPGQRNRRGRGGERRGERRVFAYSVDFESENPDSPEFPEDLREALRDGESVAASRPGRRRAQVAVRMPWSEGPCAIVLLRVKGPPAWFSGPMLFPAILVTLVVIFVALLVAGPIVARVRRLTEAVERNEAVAIEGQDEIAELGRAFAKNRNTIEAQLTSLREREAALRNYIANTSHDVMLPLSVLQGHLAALQQKIESRKPLTPDAIVPSLEEAQYLGSLLHNLNAAARLEAQPGLVHEEPVDLNRVVERVAERHRPIATRKGISLERAVPANPVEFAGDVTLLEQALGNVVQNAIRYNQAGGHVALILDGTDGKWALRVRDDGPGIPAEQRSEVIQRSFRGNEARTRHPHGMGLGLHIASDVAARHRLAFELSETEGGGLTVTFRPSDKRRRDT